MLYAFQLVCQFQDGGRQVDAVGNEFDGHAVGQVDTFHSAFVLVLAAFVEAGHGVVEVGGMGKSGFVGGTHDAVAKKEDRAKHAIYLEHGKPMLFGENNEYGLMQEGFGLKVVKLGENGITEKDILIHDAHCMDNTLQLKLALMEGPDFPIALGVIRDVEAPTYDDAVHEQIEEVSAKKKYHNFEELLMTNDTWEVK